MSARLTGSTSSSYPINCSGFVFTTTRRLDRYEIIQFFPPSHHSVFATLYFPIECCVSYNNNMCSRKPTTAAAASILAGAHLKTLREQYFSVLCLTLWSVRPFGAFRITLSRGNCFGLRSPTSGTCSHKGRVNSKTWLTFLPLLLFLLWYS